MESRVIHVVVTFFYDALRELLLHETRNTRHLANFITQLAIRLRELPCPSIISLDSPVIQDSAKASDPAILEVLKSVLPVNWSIGSFPTTMQFRFGDQTIKLHHSTLSYSSFISAVLSCGEDSYPALCRVLSESISERNFEITSTGTSSFEKRTGKDDEEIHEMEAVVEKPPHNKKETTTGTSSLEKTGKDDEEINEMGMVVEKPRHSKRETTTVTSCFEKRTGKDDTEIHEMKAVVQKPRHSKTEKGELENSLSEEKGKELMSLLERARGEVRERDLLLNESKSEVERYKGLFEKALLEVKQVFTIVNEKKEEIEKLKSENEAQKERLLNWEETRKDFLQRKDQLGNKINQIKKHYEGKQEVLESEIKAIRKEAKEKEDKLTKETERLCLELEKCREKLKHTETQKELKEKQIEFDNALEKYRKGLEEKEAELNMKITASPRPVYLDSEINTYTLETREEKTQTESDTRTENSSEVSMEEITRPRRFWRPSVTGTPEKTESDSSEQKPELSCNTEVERSLEHMKTDEEKQAALENQLKQAVNEGDNIVEKTLAEELVEPGPNRTKVTMQRKRVVKAIEAQAVRLKGKEELNEEESIATTSKSELVKEITKKLDVETRWGSGDELERDLPECRDSLETKLEKRGERKKQSNQETNDRKCKERKITTSKVQKCKSERVKIVTSEKNDLEMYDLRRRIGHEGEEGSEAPGERYALRNRTPLKKRGRKMTV